MIDNSYWLKILPVLIALAIALIQLWKARENKRPLHLWGVTTLYVVAFALTCRIMWNDQMDAARLKNEQKVWQSWMGGKVGQGQDARLRKIIRQLNQELIREKTGTVIDRFFASKADREERNLKLNNSMPNRSPATQCDFNHSMIL